MTSINTANINFKWDPKSLEIRTLAVERLLEPLVTQVRVLFQFSHSVAVLITKNHSFPYFFALFAGHHTCELQQQRPIQQEEGALQEGSCSGSLCRDSNPELPGERREDC